MLNFIFASDDFSGTYQNLAAQGSCKGEAWLVCFYLLSLFARSCAPYNISFQHAVEESTRMRPGKCLANVSPNE